MADFTSIAAISSSLVRYLEFSFNETTPVSESNVAVRLFRTEDFDPSTPGTPTTPFLSVFLYRVDFNKTMRAAWSAVGNADGESHLPLDLHYLLTPWGSNADHEHRIVGRTMQCLENTPILSGPLLDPTSNWSGNESIQFCLEDLSTEDVMRTFDSLPINYKLSIPYVARIAVISGQQSNIEGPATHAQYGLTRELKSR